ncbi:helix-turn-helix domain-containing protein [Pseudomonas sp. HMWF006]|uniref:helix-turn-helix domain-containing protein n=1 Tax=Pseudomonas sp. HMWF006 TaxID=2056843 RepID=UPI000D3FD87E|nr:helix-turn-helix transcriptional regulator [Pseudomonas sp. HMWF006]PTS93480.1 transcriptional regulator [Pseudomonas sp. HMWF006]PTT68258.1 transcriptional regulator [Pseudomonas sp. HMWF007]PTT94496.1 transcriptional regulator [Pseudomonas sp. HMWF005]
MSLRYSFAASLQLLRTRKGLSQENLADIEGSVSQPYVSKLELGKSAVSLDSSYQLAAALKVEPITLLALAVASHDHRTTRETLLAAIAELEALELADVNLATEPEPSTPPGVDSARKKLDAVQDLKKRGFTQAKAAKELGIPESTLRRLWHQGAIR